MGGSWASHELGSWEAHRNHHELEVLSPHDLQHGAHEFHEHAMSTSWVTSECITEFTVGKEFTVRKEFTVQ